MAPQEVLGGFEHQVLLAIARLDGETYTVPIVLELQERTGREVASSSVFATLRRLEKRRFLSSRVAAALPERVGRPRRMFRLQPAGIAALVEAREALQALWSGVALKDIAGS